MKRSLISVFPQVAGREVPTASRGDAAPVAFLSYADEDHAYHSVAIRALGRALEGEIRARTGYRDFRILSDRRERGWAQQWQDRIENPSDSAAILISIMTPGFFRSPQCRHELERFLAIERRMGHPDLVLPVRWTDNLDLVRRSTEDPLALAVSYRMPGDWPQPFGEPFNTPSPAGDWMPAQDWIAEVAERVRVALDGFSRLPVPHAVPACRPTGPAAGPADPAARAAWVPLPRAGGSGSTRSAPTGHRHVQADTVPLSRTMSGRGAAVWSRIPAGAGEPGPSRQVPYRPIVTSQDLVMKAFSATRLRAGYSMAGVDAFLDVAAAELHRLHALVRSVESGRMPAPGELVLNVTPAQIAATSFNRTRFLSGYCEREVDDFLAVVEREFINLRRFFAGLSEVAQPGDRGRFHPGITGPEVKRKEFTRTRLWVGYNAAQVDEFLDVVAGELDRLQLIVESGQEGRGGGGPGVYTGATGATGAGRATGLSPQNINGVRFDTTWLGAGYCEYEVDDFLDFLERELLRVQDFLS